MTRRPGWTPGALRLSALRAHPERLHVRNHKDTDVTTIYIYDEISWCGITARAFAGELDRVTTNTVTVRINSPGGDLFDGVSIYNCLAAHPAAVRVHVDGMAASCASVIAMAGDTITMGAGSQMMVHDGMALCIGNAADMTETAARLDKLSDDISGFYSRRAGGAVSAWRDAMRAETWYSGPEAVAAGLADTALVDAEDEGVDGDRDGAPVAAAGFDLSVFRFAGRHAAPAPRPVPVDEPGLFDVHALRTAVRSHLCRATALDYATLIREALKGPVDDRTNHRQDPSAHKHGGPGRPAT